jgi:hypothetical protein
MIQTFNEQLPQVQRKWPRATGKQRNGSAYERGFLRVPGVQLPAGWSPSTVTLLLETPPGFPGACPLPWFETEEDVYALGRVPHRTVSRSYAHDGSSSMRGTRFLWRAQDWNPNYCGIHTLVRMCIQRFWSAEREVKMMDDLRETLERASEDWGRAYEAHDRMRRGGR